MQVWSSNEVCTALGLDLESCDFVANGVSINTETLKGGEIFIGIRGQRVDGGIFSESAMAKGAVACIVNSDLQISRRKNVITVPDTTEALHKLAKYKRNNRLNNSKLIGITGSIGKTTIKEFIAKLSSKFCTVHFGKGNFNNHYGMPISLANCPNDAELCILEMGMSNSGEISFLSKIARPNIAVISCIAPVHLEFFSSIKEIAIAKAEIFDGMENGAYVILNSDDIYTGLIKQIADNNFNIITFGSTGDLRVTDYEFNGLNTNITIEVFGSKRSIEFNDFIPKHIVTNFLCAYATVFAAGYDSYITNDISNDIYPIQGRGKIIKPKPNIHIIDDSYNASPMSMKASIEALSQYAKQLNLRSIAVLGDMKELGGNVNEMHRGVGEIIIDTRVDILFTLGDMMKSAYEVVINNTKDTIAVHFDNIDSLINILQGFVSEHDVILIKGSNSMKMEKISASFYDK